MSKTMLKPGPDLLERVNQACHGAGELCVGQEGRRQEGDVFFESIVCDAGCGAACLRRHRF